MTVLGLKTEFVVDECKITGFDYFPILKGKSKGVGWSCILYKGWSRESGKGEEYMS